MLLSRAAISMIRLSDSSAQELSVADVWAIEASKLDSCWCTSSILSDATKASALRMMSSLRLWTPLVSCSLRLPISSILERIRGVGWRTVQFVYFVCQVVRRHSLAPLLVKRGLVLRQALGPRA